MCNCKGWDVAFYPDGKITVQQHFCRVYGDCGHVDNTLEQAADTVVVEYDKWYDWYTDAANRDLLKIMDVSLDWILEQSRTWKNRTHPSYLYYKNPIDTDSTDLADY